MAEKAQVQAGFPLAHQLGLNLAAPDERGPLLGRSAPGRAEPRLRLTMTPGLVRTYPRLSAAILSLPASQASKTASTTPSPPAASAASANASAGCQ